MIFDTFSYRKKFYHGGAAVMKYDLSYPMLKGDPRYETVNLFSKRLIDRIITESKEKLLKNAIRQQKNLIMYNSFTPLEIKNNFNIMYSGSSIISMFWDVYTNRGAEGFVMHRVSHNIILDKGRFFGLQEIFRRDTDWHTSMLRLLTSEVKSFESEMGISCFGSWESELRTSLNSNRFYLTDNGIVVYCPQGTIASDIWGIPSFLAPFSEISSIMDKKFAASLQ